MYPDQMMGQKGGSSEEMTYKVLITLVCWLEALIPLEINNPAYSEGYQLHPDTEEWQPLWQPYNIREEKKNWTADNAGDRGHHDKELGSRV